MTRKEAEEFMWKENDKSFKGIQWEQHRTIRLSHDKLIRKIYDDFESRTCESCTYKNDCEIEYVIKEHTLNPVTFLKTFSCCKWEATK